MKRSRDEAAMQAGLNVGVSHALGAGLKAGALMKRSSDAVHPPANGLKSGASMKRGCYEAARWAGRITCTGRAERSNDDSDWRGGQVTFDALEPRVKSGAMLNQRWRGMRGTFVPAAVLTS